MADGRSQARGSHTQVVLGVRGAGRGGEGGGEGAGGGDDCDGE